MAHAKLRVAIVGLDHWYTAHNLARIFSEHERTELVGIADSSLDRAQQVASQIGLAEYTSDLQKYTQSPDVDVVASFVTIDRNPEVVIAAAKNGKHVISIKPMARTLEEATEIVNAVQAAGVRFIPAETMSRQTELNQYLKSLYDDGHMGNIVSGNLILTSSLPKNWPDAPADGGWWVKPEHVPGGAWIDHSIYKIDRLRWILQKKIVRVTGRTANLIHKNLEVEDYGHAIVEFEDGSTFAIEDTWSGPAGSWRIVTQLIGSEGSVHIDTFTGDISTFGIHDDEAKWVRQPLLPDSTGLVDKIVDHIQDVGDTSYGNVMDGWENLAVCLAFYESAKTQKTVQVKEF